MSTKPSVLGFCCFGKKHCDQKQPKKDRVYYNLQLKSITEGTQGRNLEEGTDAEAMEELSSYTLLDHLPKREGVGHTTIWVGSIPVGETASTKVLRCGRGGRSIPRPWNRCYVRGGGNTVFLWPRNEHCVNHFPHMGDSPQAE